MGKQYKLNTICEYVVKNTNFKNKFRTKQKINSLKLEFFVVLNINTKNCKINYKFKFFNKICEYEVKNTNCKNKLRTKKK